MSITKTDRKAPRVSLIVKRKETLPPSSEGFLEQQLWLYLEKAPAKQQEIMQDERARKAVLHELNKLKPLMPVLERMSEATDNEAQRLQIQGDDSLKEGWLQERITSACELAVLKQENRLLSQENAELREKIKIDPLTEIANRRGYDEEVATRMEIARRNEIPLWCVMMDLDDFKFVNDRFGHQAGDQVLKEVGRRLEKETRLSDFVARYGGEEFIALLFGKSEMADDGARAATYRIKNSISAKPFFVKTDRGVKQLKITMSVGGSRFRVEQDEPGEMERRADLNLYDAKAAGKDTICLEGEYVENVQLEETERGDHDRRSPISDILGNLAISKNS